jgi:hypothetical protein
VVLVRYPLSSCHCLFCARIELSFGYSYICIAYTRISPSTNGDLRRDERSQVVFVIDGNQQVPDFSDYRLNRVDARPKLTDGSETTGLNTYYETNLLFYYFESSFNYNGWSWST